MRYGALLGWGIVIYAIMYLLWSGLVLYGLSEGVVPRIISLLTLIVVAAIAARSLRYHTWRDVLPYSIAWAVVIGLLDAVFTVPYAGWIMYTDWNVWVGYILVVAVPPMIVSMHLSERNRS